MQKLALLAAALWLSLGGLPTCEKTPAAPPDADAQAAAAKVTPVKDPILEQIYAYRVSVRGFYNARRFDELEAQIAPLRASKEVFGNGSWKVVQFYSSFGCGDEEPESMWQTHDGIHRDWIAAKPDSAAAHIAYADFLTDYAWHARGSGYAKTVTDEGWKLFEERLKAAQTVLLEARALPDRDPMWWHVGMTVALGAKLSKYGYERLIAEATAAEPKFWGYDTARAYSLLPRWYGKAGDWEAYADAATRRPDGLCAETYARIVMDLYGYYDNVFHDTQASWLTTRDGLALMRDKYPDSLEILSESANLAALAEDRAVAGKLFEQLGDRYLADTWRTPERFVRCRRWAQTGQW